MSGLDLPRSLPCIKLPRYEEFSDGLWRVPLPVGPYIIKIPWSLAALQIKIKLYDNPAFILHHPYSHVSVLCIARSNAKEGNFLVMNATLLYRVLTYHFLEEGELDVASWNPFIEVKVSRERFNSREFQQKLDEMRLRSIELQTGQSSIEMGPGKYSEEDVSKLIDSTAFLLNEYVGCGDVEEILVEYVLEEADVEKRLDILIDYLVFVLRHVEKWNKLIAQNKVIPSRKKSAAPTSDIKNDNRAELVRKLIFTESQSKIIVVSEDNVSKPQETRDLSQLETFLKSRVIGQDRAIKQVVSTFNIAGADLLPAQSLLSSMVFAGPTGVGKTELALAIAEFLKEREKENGIEREKISPLVKVDSGLFGGSLDLAIARLIGSAPPYIGSKADYRNPVKPIFCGDNFPEDRLVVLLFDEIEKAFAGGRSQGQELLGILITMLDKGMLETHWDEVVNFLLTIGIFTSNIGSKDIYEATKHQVGFGKLHTSDHLTDEEAAELNEKIYKLVRDEYFKFFPPELVGRLGTLIVFRYLTKDNLLEIANKELAELGRLLQIKHGIELKVTDGIRVWLLNHGVKREFGVRSLQRAITRKGRNLIATKFNEGSVGKESIITLSVSDPNDREADWTLTINKK